MLIGSPDWILENVDTSKRLQAFAQELGVSPDDGDAFIETLERGLAGDKDLQAGAIRFLQQLPAIRTWEIDRALITTGGINFLFAIALLCAHTSSEGERDAEGGVDLDLVLPLFDYEILDLHAAFMEGAWEINVTVPLNEDVVWIRDFRDSDRHPHPHLDFIGGKAPQTLITTCQRKPLKDYVSHPVLDHYNLTVHSIEQHQEKYMMELEGDKDQEMDMEGIITA